MKRKTGLRKESKREVPKLIKKLDIEVSKLVRKQHPICQHCGKTASRHAAHIFTRNKKITRFDPANLLALCYYCHILWAHRNPLEFSEWVETRMGRMNFVELRMLSNRSRVWSAGELKHLIEQAKMGWNAYLTAYNAI